MFVTTGEILIRSYSVDGTGNQRTINAELEWTFPLEFVEVTCGRRQDRHASDDPGDRSAPEQQQAVYDSRRRDRQGLGSVLRLRLGGEPGVCAAPMV